MKRREFITLIGSVAASWPLAAQAQQKTVPVIGFVATTGKHSARFLENVRKGLADNGYIEGQNYRFDVRETNYQAGIGQILFRDLVEQRLR